MNSKKRINFTAIEQAELWMRWRKGESLSDIGRTLGRHAATVYGVLLTNGGFAPYNRTRSSLSLSLAEREEIRCGIVLGLSYRKIAESLERAPSTIGHEVSRNGGRSSYRVEKAEGRAQNCLLRPKLCLLAKNAKLRKTVAKRLKNNWSPEQISGWLKFTYPSNEKMNISHETIYRSLFIQARGVLRKELIKHLRSNRVIRQSRSYNTKGSARGKIIDGISIHDRPAEIEDRAVPGHWEGDLISGSSNTHIEILVERKSRFTLLVKLKGKDTNSVVTALSRCIKKLPEVLSILGSVLSKLLVI